MLVNSAGEQHQLNCFERDSETASHKSCCVNWKNQLFIFGGSRGQSRQISRLTGHKLSRVGHLPFDHYGGSCNVMANKHIFLCFNEAQYDTKRCRRSADPLKQFLAVELSNYEHRWVRTSCSNSKL